MKNSLESTEMADIIDEFFQAEVLSESQLTTFSELQLTKKKAEYLLNLLLTGTSQRYELFVDYMRDHNPDIFRLLHITDFEAIESATDDKTVIIMSDSNPRYQQLSSPPISLMDMDKTPAKMDVDVLPSSNEILAISKKRKSVYQMSHPVRGVALLIVNIEFPNSDLPTRYGAEHDLDNLGLLFHKLSYNVVVFQNASRREILQEFDRQRNDVGHNNHGSFILGVSSHGQDQSFFCSDGSRIFLNEVYDYFDSIHCPYLAGKPKFVFIDASSGSARDKAISLDKTFDPPRVPKSSKSSEEPIRFSLNDMQLGEISLVRIPDDVSIPRLNIGKDSTAHNSGTIPEKSDFVIAFSTFNGYVSWRRNTHGCWFSRVLVEVFAKHAAEEHIIELLRRIRRKLAHVQTSQGYKQVNLTIDTLLKKFYLFPGVQPL